MKLPYGWLKEFVPAAPGVHETAQCLSAGGLGVASVKPFTAAHEGIVVGAVVSVAAHPNADRLKVCVVDAGAETYQVVCGAPNVREGMKAPFAPPGARLPGGKTIQVATIRGVVSHGMLCSSIEVGEGTDADGLLELTAATATGEPYVPSPEDWVMDIEVTPNRGDCLSVLGVARQLAALLPASWKLPWEASASAARGAKVDGWNVAIENPADCGLYTAQLLTGVQVAPSPDWMRKRLLACGLRPINNVVDITNYVLLELGQPLHVFDTAKLPGRALTVRRARAGEVIRTLDGVDRKLSPEVLLIACSEAPVAVAGLMGGASSEITKTTTSVLLESAWFDQVRVRRTARALGAATESSYRFERGVDPEGVWRASRRAAQLLVELAGATTGSAALEAKGTLPERHRIEMKAEQASETLGVALNVTQLKAFSERLGAGVESGPSGGDGPLRVTPPSWRLDLNDPADLIEEFAILYGYKNIPSTMPALISAPLAATKHEVVHTLACQTLRAAGFSEAQTFSFLSRQDLSRLGLDGAPEDPRARTVVLANPQSAEQEWLRTTILPGLLRSTAYNLAREAPGAMLFEVGRVFQATPSSSSAGTGRERGTVVETCSLAMVAAGQVAQDAHQPGRPLDFYDLKGALDDLATTLGFAWSWEEAHERPYAPAQCARLTVNGRTAGTAGVLSPQVAKAFDLPPGAVVAELSFDAVVSAAAFTAPVAAPARFPAVGRDLAIVMDEDVTAATLNREIEEAGAPLLESARVFDVYQGKQIAAGTKSLAFRLAFRSAERTLTEREVDEAVARIIKALETKLGAKLRTS